MKKVKFMLLSLALIAVVGGALAFKAKFSTTFCTTFARQNAGNYFCTAANGAALACPTTYTGTVDIQAASGATTICTADVGSDQKCGVNCINVLTSITTDAP